MSQNQIIQTSVNADVSAQASAVLAEIGLSISDAIRSLLNTIARKKSVPPEIFTFNETTLAAIKDAEEGRVETVTLDEILAVIDEAKEITNKKPYSLNELLSQCDPSVPSSDEDRQWTASEAKGSELV